MKTESPVSQGGITVVELMVSLLLGLVLMLGIVQIYLSNLNVFRSIDANARIQENTRFATETLARFLRIAGYREEMTSGFNEIFPPDTLVFAAGTYNFSRGETLRGSPTQIALRLQGDGNLKTCLGNGIGPNTIAGMLFYLENDVLKCSARFVKPGETNLSVDTQPLFSDISNLTFLYGIDTDGDGTTDCFDTAVNLNAANPTACEVAFATNDPWKQVVSVRVTLTLQSPAKASVTGGRLERSHSMTLALRNRLD